MNCYRKTKCKIIAGVSAVAIGLLAVVAGTTYAIAVFDAAKQEAALTGARSKFVYSMVNQCYDRARDKIEASYSLTWGDIFKDDKDNIKVPTSLYPGLNDSTLKCKQLFNGWHGWFGIGGSFNGLGEDRTDIPIESSGYIKRDDAIAFLKNIGYRTDEDVDDNLIGYTCVYFEKEGEYITDKLCAKVKTDGTLDYASGIKIQQSGYIDTKSTVDEGFSITRYSFEDVEFTKDNFIINHVGGHSFFHSGATVSNWDVSNLGCTTPRNSESLGWSYNTTFHWCEGYGFAWMRTRHINVELQDGKMTLSDLGSAIKTALYTIDGDSAPSTVGSMQKQDPVQPSLFKEEDDKNKYFEFLIGPNYTNYTGDLTPAEQYMLYYTDITESFKATIRCDYDENFKSTASVFKIDHWLEDGKMRTDCAVQNTSGKVTTVSSNKTNSLTELSLEEVVEYMNGIDINDDSFQIVDETGDVYEDGAIAATSDPDDSSDGTICSKAAGSLGWIMCSVIQGVGNSVSSIYDMIEEDFLQTDASFVARTETKGNKEVETPTYKIWKRFQELANIAFIIALLVIILSQITGFGVNNYGIKKILPSLIVVAVLVNLSFFICQIAVDLSNILGSELRERFLDFAREIEINSEFGDGSAGSIVGYIVDTVTGPGLAGIGIILFKNFNAWIWPFLLALLGVAVGILFFFLVLGIRQAGIIILIVLSPLAMICYALPNTKSLFDRWRKLLTSLLVAYPICGLLMGGGQFVGKLLLANIYSGNTSGNMSSILFFGTVDSEISNFFYVLVAMLIQVIPFFFIPSIVKSSMAAMGNLGMKISNFGRGLSRSATGAIRKSDGYRERVNRGRARDAERGIKRGELGDKVRSKLRAKGRVGQAAAFMLGGGAEAYRNSSLPGAERAAKSYERKQAARINAVAAQNAADLRNRMTVTNGLGKAEANEDNAMREDWAKAYTNDVSFMSDQGRWRAELSSALDAVEQNPTDRASMSKLRGLQDVLSRSSKGQKIMQNEYNRRMYDTQEDARSSGVSARVSEGMKLAAANLANDHSELKGVNPGFHEMLNDMSDSDSERVFRQGTFSAPTTFTDADGTTWDASTNDHYDTRGAFDFDARSIATANKGALQRMSKSINAMNPSEVEAIYRSATEALSNDNIEVTQENEKYLNDIRKAAYAKMQADFVGSYVNHGEYVDDKGRMYTYLGVDGNGDAQYQRDGTSKTYTFDGSDFMNNKTGEIMSGGRFSQSASDMFKAKYGNYQDLHAGMKINH